MKVYNLIFIGLFTIFIMMEGVSLIAIRSINDLTEVNIDTLHEFERSIVYNDLKTKSLQLVKAEKDYIITKDKRGLEIWQSKIEELGNSIEQEYKQIRREEERRLLNQYKAKNGEYRAVFSEMQKLVEAGKIEESVELSKGRLNVIADEQFAMLVQLVELNKKQIREVEIVPETLKQRSNFIMIIFIALLVIGILVAVFISRKISKPINKLTEKVDEISKGNLDVQLGKSNIEEINKLTEALDRVLTTMKLAIKRMNKKER